MKNILSILLFVFGGVACFAQNINKVEYFVDADLGYGLGVDVPLTAGTPLTVNFDVALPLGVSNGFHLLSIRAKDINDDWSIVGVRPFYKENIPTGGIPNITAMEYFIDADPGFGLGTAVALSAGSPLTQNFTVALPSVSDGFHLLSIRVKDVNNKWSVIGLRPFYKENLPAGGIPNIVAMEYFIDADPGYGLGTAVGITAGSPLTQNFTVALPTISDGFHLLSVRAKDINNKWIVVGVRPFYKENVSTVGIPNIVAMEYFIDADPGYGLGNSVAFTAGSPVMVDFAASLSGLSLGTHKVFIRAKDANNKWSVVGIKDFVVSNTFTLVGTSPVSWRKNTTFDLPFTAVGTFSTGNVFTAQMSNSSGSFTSPTVLGTFTSTISGTIAATIPNSVALSSGYQIRVVSSNPSASDNPSIPITVVAVCPPPCPTSLTLASTADDYSSGVLIKEANAQTGIIVATNKITGTARVTYLAGKTISLNPGFEAGNGTVFIAQKGGCQ